MQEFRKFLRGTGGKVLLAVIIIPFIITAFYGYFTGGGSSEVVAKVEGSSIHWGEVEQELGQMQQRLSEQMPDFEQEELDQFVQPSMALESLVTQQLILAHANKLKMSTSEKQALAYLAQLEQFQVNGKFSGENFERLSRNLGYTPSGLLDLVRSDLLRNQWQLGVIGTEFALPGEVTELRRLGEQERDAEFVVVKAGDLAESYDISDEEVEEYYEANTDSFIKPEHYIIDYVTLSHDDVNADIDISDEELKEAYDSRVKSFEEESAGSERRRIAHIFMESDKKEKLEEIRQEIEAGDISFADAAAKYSEDGGSADEGGKLGLMAKDDLPEDMANIAFSLEEGEVSEPVNSDDGLHLLLVEEIQEKRSEIASFDEMKDELREEMIKGKSESRLFDKIGELEELAFEHSDMEMPAEQVGLELRTSEPFSMEEPMDELSSKNGLEELQDEAVLEGRHNSRLVEYDEDHYIVFHMKEVIDAEPIPVEEVADQIRSQIRFDKAQQELADLKAKLEKALEEGKDFSELADILDADIETVDGLQRGDEEPSMELSEFIFSIKRSQEPMLDIKQLNSGDLALVSVNEVRDGDADIQEEEKQQLMDMVARMEQQYSEQLVTESLRENGKVKIYQERLEKLQRKGSGDEDL